MIKNEKGFTLVELLAVIVILGLLMAIAIPSVTKYITQSRKKTLISTIDSYVTAVTNAVNDNELGSLSHEKILYYIPVSNIKNDSCISLEKGGTDPFGNWKEAYVVVNYDANNYSYDYYFTFYDDAGYGMELTKIDELESNSSKIKNPTDINEDNITNQLNDRAVTTVIFEKQSDGTCTAKAAKIANGDKENIEIGDVVKIGKEEFYVMEAVNSKITMLTKKSISLDINNPIQTSNPEKITFSNTNYWNKAGVTYPLYVYDSNSNLYQYVEAYETYLKELGVYSAEANLISTEQLNELGCNSETNTCNNSSYSWLKGSYWTGTATHYYMLEYVVASGRFDSISYSANISIRPIVTIDESEIKK